jgi:hypothetical protein
MPAGAPESQEGLLFVLSRPRRPESQEGLKPKEEVGEEI